MYSVHLTTGFSPYLIEELPTLIMALGSIDSRLRSDMAFGLTFFLTRIVWHAMAVGNVLILPANHPMNHMAWFGCLTMALHLYWFTKWVAKYALKGKGERIPKGEKEGGKERTRAEPDHAPAPAAQKRFSIHSFNLNLKKKAA